MKTRFKSYCKSSVKIHVYNHIRNLIIPLCIQNLILLLAILRMIDRDMDPASSILIDSLTALYLSALNHIYNSIPQGPIIIACDVSCSPI